MPQTLTASLMRSVNRSAILELIRRNSPLTRAQIARHLQVSAPTVMRIVDSLIEEDLVRACGSSEASRGRPGSLLEFNGQ
ncbi:MAG: MarR family transcriptional regulator, partial [Anaerolineales bacterium]|nr:MarR family transcriptional regulator [Anaerolineales bacterium]